MSFSERLQAHRVERDRLAAEAAEVNRDRLKPLNDMTELARSSVASLQESPDFTNVFPEVLFTQQDGPFAKSVVTFSTAGRVGDLLGWEPDDREQNDSPEYGARLELAQMVSAPGADPTVVGSFSCESDRFIIVPKIEASLASPADAQEFFNQVTDSFATAILDLHDEAASKNVPAAPAPGMA